MARKPSSKVSPKAVSGPLAAKFVDGMENILSGMGTDRDKSTATRYAFVELDRQQLEAAYRSDWIARKVVDLPAQDATREWRTWQAEKADITKIEDAEDTLGLRRKVLVTLQRARLYGGAALLLGVDQGKLNEELILERVRKDSLKFIHSVSRNELAAGPIDWNLDSKYYGHPQYYTRSQGSSEQIHPSRVIRFIGNEIPDPQVSQGWGDSVLQTVSDSIKQVSTVSGGIAQMVDEAKLDVIKIKDLIEQLGNKEYEDRLKLRFGLANVAKSVYSTILLDSNEEWERIQSQFAGLPDVVKLYLIMACGASDIPATRMLSQSPAGLSATGESDTRNYYDRISTEQNTVIRPALESLDEVIIRSTLGTMDDSIFYEWTGLWQMDEKQKAEIDKSTAETFKVDHEAGLIPSEVLRDARINQLIESGTYPGLEQILTDFGPLDPIDTVPEPTDPLAPPAGGVPNPPPVPPTAAQPESQTTGEPTAQGGEAQAADAIAKRVRDARIDDATPRTLYVRRDLVNVAEVRAWAETVGLTLQADPHVTICYSRAPVDWLKIGEAWGQDDKGILRVAPGGPRIIEKMGSNSIALQFAASNLQYRHCDLIERLGAKWDYPEYIPHMIIEQHDGPIDVASISPYHGELVFGPEIFEEIK